MESTKRDVLFNWTPVSDVESDGRTDTKTDEDYEHSGENGLWVLICYSKRQKLYRNGELSQTQSTLNYKSWIKTCGYEITNQDSS